MSNGIKPLCAAALMIGSASAMASAATIAGDDFNTDTSANYNVFVTPGAAAGGMCSSLACCGPPC